MEPRITLALAFAAGVGAGGGTAVLVDADQFTFTAPVTSAKVLSAPAAQRFAAFDATHFEYVHIIPRGIQSAEDPNVYAPVTHARYSVPSTSAGRAPITGEHWSPTRSETVPGIVALVDQVILPAAQAQCPDLQDSEAYPAPSLAHADYVGVEGDKAVALLRVPSLLEGLEPVVCRVRTDAPPEAFAAVHAMKAQFLVPAIKEERGLR